ncbi:hypothetical protein [Methylocystis rosea]|uniref:hypothetical protein n=1 Tax=Methylocystis rosea TaxID=173366 RepID=UPI00197B4E41|nr:hypothetical protein [Methylocystis rosea]
MRRGTDSPGLYRLSLVRQISRPVVGGLFPNWFGDSLDGTLARYRAIERPHYGYFIDHSSDFIAQTLIVVGLGVSS